MFLKLSNNYTAPILQLDVVLLGLHPEYIRWTGVTVVWQTDAVIELVMDSQILFSSIVQILLQHRYFQRICSNVEKDGDFHCHSATRVGTPRYGSTKRIHVLKI